MSRAEKRRLAWEAIHGRGQTSRNERRPFLGVSFECCKVYARLYRNEAGDAYEGRCPHCRRSLTIRIGEEGTSHRFFRAW